MARSKTSQRWLKEHFNDIYVQKAQQEGYRSRAVYKLMEIQEKDRLIRPGMVVLDALYAELGDSAVNLVISDMAPNTSGVRSVDQAKSMYLVELALDFAQSRLAAGGDFLTKIFHGPGFDTLLRSLKSQFLTVQTRKPEASRARSQETYLLARGFKRQH